MCGIIGYTGHRPAAQILLEGLSRLEYRGYDSAGIAVMGPSGQPSVQKSHGKLSVLVEALEDGPPRRNQRHWPYPMGHPRWTDRFQRPSTYGLQ